MSELSGKTIVFTGTLSMKRALATTLAIDAGAKVTSAISGNTDIVVYGSGAGSKLDQAKAKGIQLMTEEDFVEIAQGGGSKKKPAAKKGKAKVESDSEEEAPAPKKKPAAKKGKQAKEESESEEEEEAPPKKKPAAKAAPKKGKKQAANHDEDEEEDDAPPAKAIKTKAKPAKKVSAKKGKAAKEESEDEESEAEEEDKPAPAAKPAPAPPQSPKGGDRRAPVDRLVPGREGFRVHGEYNITLNQTNIGNNNNKYYIIQVIEKDGKFYAWNRWGRVGEPGQNKLEPCGNEAAAIKSFEKKFREKTMNSWDSRANFVPHKEKYTIVEMDEDENAGNNNNNSGNGDNRNNDAPMGKLSKSQIEKGQRVLADLGAAIESGNKSELNTLSSLFYTLIPTNFGRQRPPPITTIEKVREKEELLKFYLRMGFEEVDEKDTGLTPIAGVMDMELPPTLQDAAGNVADKSEIGRSVAKGKVLAEKNAGNPTQEMDKDMYGSIMLYTSNAIYKDLNKVLRDENRTAAKKYFKYLRLLLESTNRLSKKNSQLWRGISVDLSGQYTVGKTITWWGVSSCTSDEKVARGFAGGCSGDSTLLKIDTKTAVDISEITFYSNEKESLLMPGTQLLVKSCVKKGKMAEIHLEEVGRLVN